MGAGTGSVSCAMALAAYRGAVYAVEHKEEAVALIEENKNKLGLPNLHIVFGAAPAALSELPRPDAVFIGGSGGRMEEIFRTILEEKPGGEALPHRRQPGEPHRGAFDVREIPPDQRGYHPAHRRPGPGLGRYHMMLGQNPVYILTGEGQP